MSPEGEGEEDDEVKLDQPRLVKTNNKLHLHFAAKCDEALFYPRCICNTVRQKNLDSGHCGSTVLSFVSEGVGEFSPFFLPVQQESCLLIKSKDISYSSRRAQIQVV